MAAKILYMVLLIGLLFSCKSEQITMQEYTFEKEIFLTVNETFEYSLGNGIATEGGFSIEKQAAHFSISDIIINSTGMPVLKYVYKPKANFKGEDSVVLKNCISIGGGNCDKIELFKFIFYIK